MIAVKRETWGGGGGWPYTQPWDGFAGASLLRGACGELIKKCRIKTSDGKFLLRLAGCCRPTSGLLGKAK